MATLTNTGNTGVFTLSDLKARDNLDPRLNMVVNVMSQQNLLYQDAIWQEGTEQTTHTYSISDSLPVGKWGMMNRGYPVALDKVRQVKEDLGQKGIQAVVDDKIIRNSRNPDAVRLNRDKNVVEGLFQDIQLEAIYGDQVNDPSGVNGLATRFNSLNFANVINNGGALANQLSSIWLIQWDVERCYFAYPMGSPNGIIETIDRGLVPQKDDLQNTWFGWTTEYVASLGIAVPDPRCAFRVANIETKTGATVTFNEDKILDALNQMLNPEKVMIYCNRAVMAQIVKKAKNAGSAFYQPGQEFGGQWRLPQLFGRPLRLVEQIFGAGTGVAGSTSNTYGAGSSGALSAKSYQIYNTAGIVGEAQVS